MKAKSTRGRSGQEADDLTLLDLERDRVEGADLAVAPADQTADGRGEARLALGHEERLAQLVHVDDRHRPKGKAPVW